MIRFLIDFILDLLLTSVALFFMAIIVELVFPPHTIVWSEIFSIDNCILAILISVGTYSFYKPTRKKQ